jgi:mono/diheme cytochrome c family protein
MPRKSLLAFIAVLSAAARLPAADAAPKPVDYSRDVQPILTANCYACHGPDEGKRKGKFRLDVRDATVKKAVTPGDAAHSPLITRVTTTDSDRVMPPPDSKKDRLSAAQVEVLRRWIDQGAKFDIHWAYVKPTRPTLPAPKNKAWVRNPVDAFVAAGQEARGFTAAPEADRVTLIRRLSFDLIGLPPTPQEVDTFVNDRSPEAYEKLVDRLLGSKHFGERMAENWLDAVRYADTAGYHSDNHRDVWLFRDYVIDAFNANKRFDQFTVEQLAGDLLPNATTEQRIASGYNRLLQTTEEGGAQAREYTAKYAADRVRNASSVWMASTMGCCECHNHKFDPFTTKDFYSFEAFFADVQEKAVGRQDQTPIMTPETEAKIKKLDTEIGRIKADMAKPMPELDAGQAKWEEKAKADKAKLPKPVADALAVEPAKRTPQQKEALANHYRTIAPELESLRKELAAAQGQRDALMKTVPTTLVSTSGPPRVVHVLARGNWLDDSGEIVQPAVPGFLAALDSSGKRATRLDLARWIVSADNPLTARVFVNRMWKICFGQGIVKSLDDFGIQGTLPSHPQLLDWLAEEFVESGWDVKHMLKLMVLSNAYRQSSVTTKEVREKDPANVWLARQGRFRLDAEMLRDNALEVSGLLSRKIGGPSVKPYQPAGYWSFLNFPTREWQADKGESLYRRGLYTYWCRTFLHPSLLAFDAPTREECTVERTRSSTPLQALVLLNDPIYVEAARVLAEKIVKEGGKDTAARLDWAYRRAVSRGAKPDEVTLLTELYRKHLAEFQADRTAAEKAVTIGQSPLPKDMNIAELAAWTSVARVILNLHETITRN